MEQQQTYYPETTRSQQDYDSKQRRFDLTELQEEYNAKPVPFIRVDSAITVTRKKPITIDLERSIFLPGQVIHGTITVDPAYNSSRGRIDVHLACSFRVINNDSDNSSKTKQKQSIFKVMMNPIYISSKETTSTTFSLTIPTDLPAYNPNDETIGAKIEYKIKAIYEILSADLPLSLYPKCCKPIFISAQISPNNYLIPMRTKKQLTVTIPRDVMLMKAKKLKKGEKGIVSARLYLPKSCFLPGENVPFSLEIQHIAPIKHLQGIQVILERITRIQFDGIESVDTEVMDKVNLPLVCDLKENKCVIEEATAAFRIPEDISPSITGPSIIPFQVQYRLQILINMDMQQHHLLEDTVVPLRKRDRAYSMVTKMVIGSLEEEHDVGPSFHYGTTIELELPVTIGTATILQKNHMTSTAAANNVSRNRLSLPTVLSSSSSSLIVTSPEDILSPSQQQLGGTKQHNIMINRFDSDPTFNRSSSPNYLLLQQQQQRRSTSMFLSTASLLSIDQECHIERPPSAPPLIHLQQQEDQSSPPPYLE